MSFEYLLPFVNVNFTEEIHNFPLNDNFLSWSNWEHSDNQPSETITYFYCKAKQPTNQHIHSSCYHISPLANKSTAIKATMQSIEIIFLLSQFCISLFPIITWGKNEDIPKIHSSSRRRNELAGLDWTERAVNAEQWNAKITTKTFRWKDHHQFQ